MGSEQTCSSTVNKQRFSIRKQGLGIILSLVDTLNNAIIINISTSIYYSETLSCWIKNTNSVCKAIKEHLKDIVQSTNECPTLDFEQFIGGTNTTNHKGVTHGAHTGPFHHESR